MLWTGVLSNTPPVMSNMHDISPARGCDYGGGEQGGGVLTVVNVAYERSSTSVSANAVITRGWNGNRVDNTWGDAGNEKGDTY